MKVLPDRVAPVLTFQRWVALLKYSCCFGLKGTFYPLQEPLCFLHGIRFKQLKEFFSTLYSAFEWHLTNPVELDEIARGLDGEWDE